MNINTAVVQAWVLVNRQVYAVPLRVARTFYVNSSLPPENPVAVALGRRVVRTLPYGQEPFNVYQVRAEDLLHEATKASLKQEPMTASLLKKLIRPSGYRF